MKTIAWGCAYFLSILVVLLLLIWFRPSWWWNPQALQWAQNRWLPEAQVDWENLQLSAKNSGLLEKTVSLSGNDFCFAYKRTDVCWQNLLLEVKIDLNKDPFWSLKNLEGESKKFLIHVDDFVSPNSESTPFVGLHQQSQDIQKIIGSFFRELPSTYALKIPDFQVHQGALVFEGRILLSPQVLEGNASWDGNKAELRLGLNPKLDLKALWQNSDYQVSLEVEGPRQVNPDLNIGLRLTQQSGGGSDFLRQVLEKPLDISARLKLDPTTYRLAIETFSIPLGKFGKGLRIGECSLVAEEGSVTEVRVSCPTMQYRAAITDPSLRNAKEKLKLKETFDFDLNGVVNEKVLRGAEEGMLADIKATLKTLENDLVTLSGYAHWEFLKENNKILSRPKDLDLTLQVPRFARLERALRTTAFAIPSPINSMGGRGQVSLKKISTGQSGFEIGFRGLLDLKSDSVQSIKASVDGTLIREQKNEVQPFFVKGVIDLDQVYIQIPPFDPLRGFPPVTSDPRVTSGMKAFPQPKKTKARVAKKSPVRWDLKVQSRSETSLRLYYELVSPYLGFQVDANLTNSGSQLTVLGKKPAKLTYLRREITLQRFKVLRANPKAEQMDVDLRLVYQATDYKIFIDVIGTVDKPTVKLSSAPSLSRSDVISVLIYNRTSSDLTRNQSESVGGADSAMKDKTLGLFGIWAFASTPIESVSYDSATQSYRAQVKLPGKVTLDIGTDWETVQNLSLRRQIGENLAIITSYEPGEGAEGLGDVFLQKEWSFE